MQCRQINKIKILEIRISYQVATCTAHMSAIKAFSHGSARPGMYPTKFNWIIGTSKNFTSKWKTCINLGKETKETGKILHVNFFCIRTEKTCIEIEKICSKILPVTFLTTRLRTVPADVTYFVIRGMLNSCLQKNYICKGDISDIKLSSSKSEKLF